MPSAPAAAHRARHGFASDNTAGICPEAWAALAAANAGRAASYGDDEWTARAVRLLREIFETDCEVFFVFNGTAANALALAALCRRHQSILCHESAHINEDECAAPEFFTGGAKLLPVAGPAGKLRPADLAPVLGRGHGVHFPRPRVLSLTQSTELGTVYRAEELAALTDFARSHGLVTHVDGARFANAVAAHPKLRPADLSWRAGVDVLCFGGTKNGLGGAEAVLFFNRELAREFDCVRKQGAQLASKMRFLSAPWAGLLADGAWRRHAAHANAMAQKLAAAIRALPPARLLSEPEANAVFVELPPAAAAVLQAQGWVFHRFIGEHGYRLMCAWDTQDADLDAFLAGLRAALAARSA